MNWTTLLVIALALIMVLVMKRSGQITPKLASAYLKNGASVVDVRTPGEFTRGHLPGAINLPLGEIGRNLPHWVKDKEQVLLLHCQSCMRSSFAVKKLKLWDIGTSSTLVLMDGLQTL